MAEQLNFQITINGEEKTIGTIRELRTALKEAEFEAFKLSQQFGEADPRVLKLREEIGTLKDAIQDSASATANFAKGAGAFPAIGKAIQGIAAGFTAVQGAIGLLGVESKEVEQQLLKVQSALALTQGIQSVIEAGDAWNNLGGIIKNNTLIQKANTAATAAASATMKALGISVDTTSTSFKALKIAIASTGVLALVVVVGELVSAFNNYQNAAEKAKAAQDALNESIAKGAKAELQGVLDAINNEEKVVLARAKNRGASEKEIFDLEQSFRKRRAEAQIRYWEEVKTADKEGAQNALREIDKINADGSAAALNFQTEQNKKRKEANTQATKERIAEQEQLEKDKEQRDQKAFEVQVEAYKATLTDREKALYEIEAKYEQQRSDLIRAGIYDFSAIERQKEIEKEKVRKEFNDKELEENNKKLKDFIQYLKDRKQIEDDANRVNEERRLETQELNATTSEERKQVELAALSSEYTEKYNLAVKNKEDLNALNELYAAKESAINKKYADEDKKTEEAKIKVKQDSLAQTAQLLGDLAELTGRQTAVGKALALGQIAVDTALAISSLTKNSEQNPANATTFGAAGAIQFAAGLIRILANVKRAKDLLTNQNATISTAPPTQTGFGAAAPLQPFASASVTSLSQSTINALGNQAVRAYVIETDMTTNQQRIQAIRQRARFG